jgi:hypothetical protein
MNHKTEPPTAYDALEACKAARANLKPLKERFDQAFDKHLETSDRPITLRDLMFALVAIDQIASTTVWRLEEILNKVPDKEQIFRGSTFDTMEHDNLRSALFELYYSHASTQFSEEFWKEFYTPWRIARDEELQTQRTYTEARKREGIPPGQKPIAPSDAD